MHVVDEVLLVHDIHLGDKLLLDDLGHGDGVLVVPPDLGDPPGRPPAQRRQEVLLEPGVEILRDVVPLGADVDRLLAARPRPAALPAVHGSHLILTLLPPAMELTLVCLLYPAATELTLVCHCFITKFLNTWIQDTPYLSMPTCEL